jgi:hypothetical protein
LKSDNERILAMLADGEWHSRRSMLRADLDAGGPGFTLRSRAAELRRRGYEVECRHAGGRDWEYRLIVHPTTLFEVAE